MSGAPTAEFVRTLLSYDPETGEFTRLVPCGGQPAGAIAGGFDVLGYRRIGIGGTQYFAHRLALLITTGEWPVGEVDHRNGDKADNRLANLRAVSHTENVHNVGRRRNNTSGHPGVSWNRRLGAWSAGIYVDGRKRHLGYFDSITAAASAYLAAKRHLHPSWASGRGATEEESESMPDDDAYVDRPALGRTHPYGGRA